jgi:hypothetical protein
MSKQNWKDIVDKVGGREPDPVVYDFKAPRGKGNSLKTKTPGQFKVRANEEGTGVFE